MSLTHLQRLEAESIDIMREAVSEAEKPVMLYSIGKDCQQQPGHVRVGGHAAQHQREVRRALTEVRDDQPHRAPRRRGHRNGGLGSDRHSGHHAEVGVPA